MQHPVYFHSWLFLELYFVLSLTSGLGDPHSFCSLCLQCGNLGTFAYSLHAFLGLSFVLLHLRIEEIQVKVTKYNRLVPNPFTISLKARPNHSHPPIFSTLNQKSVSFYGPLKGFNILKHWL